MSLRKLDPYLHDIERRKRSVKILMPWIAVIFRSDIAVFRRFPPFDNRHRQQSRLY